MTILPCCHTMGVEIFACARAGCRECQEALLRKNERLIHHILRRQRIGGIEYEDLIQEGRIALWQSILHFDPGRGCAFSTYAWSAICHQFWHYEAQADQSCGDDEIEEWLDLPGQAEAAWQEQQVWRSIQEGLECLPERSRRVIELAYGFGAEWPHSLAEIGREWGISRERVRQLRNNALVSLRLPALSIQLRSLCEQDSRAAYQRALSLNRAWQRSQRRRP